MKYVVEIIHELGSKMPLEFPSFDRAMSFVETFNEGSTDPLTYAELPEEIK